MSRPPSQKKRPTILATSVAALLTLGLLLATPKAAADEYWDGTTTTGSGVTNGQGGSGTWDNVTTNWVDATGNNPHVYNPNDLAIFATTGGTVTLGDNITFTALRFDVDGYTIDPGAGPFNLIPVTGATIATASGVTVNINPVITGTGSVTANGSGTINVNGTNDYAGGTILNSGRLNANSGSAFGTGTLTINGGTIGTTTAGGQTIGNPVVIGGNFSVATNVDTANPGNQNLIFAGTVDLGGAVRTITGVTPGGQVQFSNVISNGGVTFTTVPAVNTDANTPYVAFIYSGPGNTYTGLTTVTNHALLAMQSTGFDGAIRGNLDIEGNGVVEYIGGSAIPNQIADTSTVTVNSPGSTLPGIGHFDGLELRGSSDTIGTLLGSGTVGLGDGTLTIGIGGNFTGVIEDGAFAQVTGGSLTMAGTGTLILGGLSTYHGATTISSGTIRVNIDNALPFSSAVTINTGAVLDVNNHTQQVGSIAGGGTIDLGSTSGVLVAGFDNTDTSFSGVIKDGGNTPGTGGSFFKVGIGTLTLSGPNTYTGTTLVNAGTLSAGAINTIPSGSLVEVTQGATLALNTFNQTIGSLSNDTITTAIPTGGTVNLGTATLTMGGDNNSTAFSGVIQGAGGITKEGTGTFFLEGNNNTFIGPTVINAGAITLDGTSVSKVTVNSGGTFNLSSTGHLNTGTGSTPVTVNSSGTFDNFGSLIVSGAGSRGTQLSGNGALVNNFSGATITGDTGVFVNNPSGVATIINEGTITGTGGTSVNALGSAGVTIGDFGKFVGAVQMGTGTNTVIIGTQVPYTPIAGGAGKNDTLRLAGANQDTLKLAQFPGYEFLNKVGGGMWTLTGTNPFPRGTTIDGGTLNVQGTLISNTLVRFDGTLAGTGAIAGNVMNFGNVMPGTPTSVITSTATPGTLSLKGNYTQGSTGTLTIQINGSKAGQFSTLAASGHAQLDGNLVLNKGGKINLKMGQKLTFLTAADGVSGTFSHVTDPFAGGTIIATKVVYDPNDVALVGTQGSFLSIDSQFHLTPNQKAVATMLDGAAADPRAARLMSFLDKRPLKQLPDDFDHIAPEEMASVYRIGVSLADVQARNVQRRTADLRAGASGFSASGFQTTGGPNYSGGLGGPNGPDANGKEANETLPDRHWNTFIAGVGDFVHVGDSANARGFDLNTGGVTVGADYRLTPKLAVGLTAGYAGTNANLTEDGRLLVNSGKVGVYGTYFTGGYYADASVTGGVSNYSTRRSSLDGDAFGSTRGSEVEMLVDTGYDWRLDALTIGPTAAFQYTYVGIDGFTERGSLTPLRYAGQHQSSIRSTFGLHLAYDWKVGNVIVRPEAALGWQHEYGDRSYSIDSALASGAGDVFSVADTALGRDSLLFGGGVAVLWNPRTSTYLYYDADLLKKEYNSQSVTGGLRMSF